MGAGGGGAEASASSNWDGITTLTAILNRKGRNSGGRPPNLGCRRQPTGEAGVGILKLVGDSWGMIGILRNSLG